jgi:hypothetical protein
VARAGTFTDADLAEMQIIVAEASELLRRWTITVEAGGHP